MPLHTSNSLGGFPLLSLLVFLPLLAAGVLALLPRAHRSLYFAVGLLASGATLVMSLVLFVMYRNASDVAAALGSGVPVVFADPPDGALEWLPGGIGYQVGVDGIGIVLVTLTALLAFLAILWSMGHVTERPRAYVALLLALETGMLGVFVSLDLFLFYVFWEASLIPMYFLIGAWGGAGRVYSTLKFLLYTMAGSALMLVAIVAVVLVTGSPSFALADVMARTPNLSPALQLAFFAAFALAFAVKVPLFPFHTWLPDAHVEAPTAGSVLLAGILLKLGSFGFIRFAMPMFPEAAQVAVPWIMALAIIGIWYGAWVAYSQKDIKSLVAYSSVSHMGVVMVGLFALNANGMAGGVLQMVNHGIVTGALFFLVGMLYERAHSRQIADFSGLWATMPRFSVLFLVVLLASIGLPVTNGFVGEWLSLLGAFQAQYLFGTLAAFGIVLGAVYMLWAYQRMFFGPANPLAEKLPDLTARDLLVLAPLIVLIFWIGLFPDTLLGPISTSSQAWLDVMNGALGAVAGR
jgi:NADH-quinone oxidoreductase subunit M